MKQYMPQSSIFVQSEEKKTLPKNTVIPGAVLATGILVTSAQPIGSFAKENVPVIATKITNIVMAYNENGEKEITPKKQENVEKNNSKTILKSTVQQQIDQVKKTAKSPVVFKADTVYKKEYKVHNTNLPLVSNLTQEQVSALKDMMIRPLPRVSYSDISSPFGPREMDGQDFHHGIDYPAPMGTPIYAAADGVVVYSGKASGYGNWIVLKHDIKGQTLYTIYGHMRANDLLVKPGEIVKQGEMISRVGSEGNATGPHLHFSIALDRVANNPRLFYDYVNPTFSVNIIKSDTYTYQGRSSQISKKLTTFDDYWGLAKDIEKKTGWKAQLLFSQWYIETNHFTSHVLHTDNNLAGMTWYPGCGFEKGSPRPVNEGGNYIKYPDVETGILSFINRNHRYDHVKKEKTPEAQAKEVAKQGWANNNDYANMLISQIQVTKDKVESGVIKDPTTPSSTDTSGDNTKTTAGDQSNPAPSTSTDQTSNGQTATPPASNSTSTDNTKTTAGDQSNPAPSTSTDQTSNGQAATPSASNSTSTDNTKTNTGDQNNPASSTPVDSTSNGQTVTPPASSNTSGDNTKTTAGDQNNPVPSTSIDEKSPSINGPTTPFIDTPLFPSTPKTDVIAPGEPTTPFISTQLLPITPKADK